MATVVVQILRASDLAKVQKLGVQDPYVIIKYGEAERQTRTANNGGTDPVFNETFQLPLVPGNTVLTAKIFNERGRSHGVIGTAKIDFVSAFETGALDKSFPVTTEKGGSQGLLQVSVRVPRPPVAHAPSSGHPVAAATEAVKSISLEQSAAAYDQALADARAKFLADVETAMVPHKAVCTGLAANFVDSVKEVKDEAEDELGKVFEEARGKQKELAVEAAKEWGKIGQEFREDIVKTLVKHDPAAKDRFAKRLEVLSAEMYDNGSKTKGLFEQAIEDMVKGMVALEEKYKASMAEAIEAYEAGFYKCLSRYKNGVEDELKDEAEKKAREATEKYRPPGGTERAVPSAPPAPSHSAPPPPQVYYPPPPPPVHAAPPPQYYAPPPPHAAVPPAHASYPYAPAAAGAAAGAAVGVAAAAAAVPNPEAEQARKEAEAAKQQAYYAQQAAAKAQHEAEMQRQHAQRAQAVMAAEIMHDRRRRAVRRGVVGGVVLAKVIR